VIGALQALDKCRLEGRFEDAFAQAVATNNERVDFIAACRPQMAGVSTTLTAVAARVPSALVAMALAGGRDNVPAVVADVPPRRDPAAV
jgi:hypothetical protein